MRVGENRKWSWASGLPCAIVAMAAMLDLPDPPTAVSAAQNLLTVIEVCGLLAVVVAVAAEISAAAVATTTPRNQSTDSKQKRPGGSTGPFFCSKSRDSAYAESQLLEHT